MAMAFSFGLRPNHHRLLLCWQNAKRFTVRRAVYPKVGLVDGEDAVGVEFAREVNQAGVGKLSFLVFVLGENLVDGRQIVRT